MHETVAVWARNDLCTSAIADNGMRYHLDSSIAGSETTVDHRRRKLVVAVLTLAAYSLVWVSFRLRPK